MTTPQADDRVTLGVVVARLDDLRRDVRSLRDELIATRRDFVTRGEWVTRNEHVDSRFADMVTQVQEAKASAKRPHTPWWSVATAVVAIVTVSLLIVQAIT